jgi:hypothetical protein
MVKLSANIRYIDWKLCQIITEHNITCITHLTMIKS